MFERVLDTPVAVSDHSFSMHAKYSEKIIFVTQKMFCASTKWMIPYLARRFLILEKRPVISVYWFAAQHHSGIFRRK